MTETRKPVFYGRRKGRPLNKGRSEAMDDYFPQIEMPAGEDIPQDKTALRKLFGDQTRKIWLEVGFGNGEHVVGQAAANPDVGIIGCEPFINGVAACTKAAQDQELSNLRIHADDARLLMDQLPTGCIDRAFVLFADPWRKTRHANRRFVGPDNLPRLARLIRPGGQLRLATDWPDLARWMLRHTLQHPNFEWTAESAADWRTAPSDWIPTRYQLKTEAQGRKPKFFIFNRV